MLKTVQCCKSYVFIANGHSLYLICIFLAKEFAEMFGLYIHSRITVW